MSLSKLVGELAIAVIYRHQLAYSSGFEAGLNGEARRIFHEDECEKRSREGYQAGMDERRLRVGAMTAVAASRPAASQNVTVNIPPIREAAPNTVLDHDDWDDDEEPDDPFTRTTIEITVQQGDKSAVGVLYVEPNWSSARLEREKQQLRSRLQRVVQG